MEELLRKLAMEGWWLWALVLFVVTMAYLARHRVGFGALARRWDHWRDAAELEPLLSDGEKIELLAGPVALTDRRVLVRSSRHGYAIAQGARREVCNVDYGETWMPPVAAFGIVYLLLALIALLLSGGAWQLILLGAAALPAGVVLILAPFRLRSAVLMITFSSGRPILVTTRMGREQVESLLSFLSASRGERGACSG